MGDSGSHEAGKKVIEAEGHLGAAAKALSEVVVDQCAGTEELTTAKQNELLDLLTEVVRLRNKISDQACNFR